jgi:putative salt-induced outer membrane protein YdiY
MGRHAAGCACAALLAVAASVAADEVRLTNGDRVTGTIVRVVDGKMTMKSEVLGDLAIPMKSVATFATDAPVEIHLGDGAVLHQPVAAAEDGRIRTAGGTVVGPQTVPLASIAAVNPAYGHWSGSLSAGALVTRGNSETESFNAAVEAVRRGERDRLSLGASYLYASQKDENGQDQTTADAWRVEGQYDYFVTKRLYPYARMLVERDRPAEVLLRLIPGAGLGYEWLQGPTWFLETEGGLAWRYEELDCENDPPPAPPRCRDRTTTDENVSGRLAYGTKWKPREGLTLFHDLEYFPSFEDAGDFFLDADAGLRVALWAGLFSELKAEWRHDQTPAMDAKRNDFRYLLNVGWSFE